MRIASLITLAAALTALPGVALAAGKSAAPSFTLTTTDYDQDFDALPTDLPAGFQIVEQGTGGAADSAYVAGTGSSNAGNTYSFGNSADRALGSLASGTVTPIYFGGVFTNGTGGTIESLTFSYDGEQWRAGNSSDDLLNFQFSLDATEVDNGTWSDVNSLDFLPVVLAGNIALNGNLAANRLTLNGVIAGLSIAEGGRFSFRWVDVNSGGNDHGLAVDNLGITAVLAQAGAVPEPSAWALLILGFGAVGGALRRRRIPAFA